MKPFNIEEAKAGKQVCTREGEKVDILTFSSKNDFPIVGLITDKKGRQEPMMWNNEGRTINSALKPGVKFTLDLMIMNNKKIRWINIYYNNIIYYTDGNIYQTEDMAKTSGLNNKEYTTTIKIEWEE